ncbi:TPA: FRG domain-containing protein [Stenotrophomonas maltophilia]|uniref:FRG domain-containing protein n=1 Tax=Stenotrophomonas maltophilia TaxID=40324 RepID=UPI00255641D9|nr:FRG domain-containing protein [Stenotrophomonas maltophilia]
MAKSKPIVVNTLTAYVEELDKLLTAAKDRNPNVRAFQNWYRGISSVNHKLVPALFRLKGITDPVQLLNVEAAMMVEFERHAILRGVADPDGEDARSPILKLFHMQHYGIPTRLLDWSTNPFIALYFALSSPREEDCNPAVWVLDPWDWNRAVFKRKSWSDRGPAHVTDSAVHPYHPKENYDARDLSDIDPDPVAVIGVYNTERMRAQRGVFTFFGKETEPMEAVAESYNMNNQQLVRIEIDKDAADEVFNRLFHMGYTDSVSYPDFQGVAMEIRRIYGFSV